MKTSFTTCTTRWLVGILMLAGCWYEIATPASVQMGKKETERRLKAYRDRVAAEKKARDDYDAEVAQYLAMYNAANYALNVLKASVVALEDALPDDNPSPEDLRKMGALFDAAGLRKNAARDAINVLPDDPKATKDNYQQQFDDLMKRGAGVFDALAAKLTSAQTEQLPPSPFAQYAKTAPAGLLSQALPAGPGQEQSSAAPQSQSTGEPPKVVTPAADTKEGAEKTGEKEEKKEEEEKGGRREQQQKTSIEADLTQIEADMARARVKLEEYQRERYNPDLAKHYKRPQEINDELSRMADGIYRRLNSLNKKIQEDSPLYSRYTQLIITDGALSRAVQENKIDLIGDGLVVIQRDIDDYPQAEDARKVILAQQIEQGLETIGEQLTELRQKLPEAVNVRDRQEEFDALVKQFNEVKEQKAGFPQRVVSAVVGMWGKKKVDPQLNLVQQLRGEIRLLKVTNIYATTAQRFAQNIDKVSNTATKTQLIQELVATLNTFDAKKQQAILTAIANYNKKLANELSEKLKQQKPAPRLSAPAKSVTPQQQQPGTQKKTLTEPSSSGEQQIVEQMLREQLELIDPKKDIRTMEKAVKIFALYILQIEDDQQRSDWLYRLVVNIKKLNEEKRGRVQGTLWSTAVDGSIIEVIKPYLIGNQRLPASKTFPPRPLTIKEEEEEEEEADDPYNIQMAGRKTLKKLHAVGKLPTSHVPPFPQPQASSSTAPKQSDVKSKAEAAFLSKELAHTEPLQLKPAPQPRKSKEESAQAKPSAATAQTQQTILDDIAKFLIFSDRSGLTEESINQSIGNVQDEKTRNYLRTQFDLAQRAQALQSTGDLPIEPDEEEKQLAAPIKSGGQPFDKLDPILQKALIVNPDDVLREEIRDSIASAITSKQLQDPKKVKSLREEIAKSEITDTGIRSWLTAQLDLAIKIVTTGEGNRADLDAEIREALAQAEQPQP